MATGFPHHNISQQEHAAKEERASCKGHKATVLLKQPNPARMVNKKMVDEAGRSLPGFQPFTINTKGFLNHKVWW